MKLYIHTPYSTARNLGAAYNDFMRLLPEDSAACFIDGDCCFLTPDYGHILHRYVNKYPNNVLTCWTNRTHILSEGQRYPFIEAGSVDMLECIKQAIECKDITTATIIRGPVSGFLLVVPKSIWNKVKFRETNTFRPGEPNLLGVDNNFTNDVRAHRIEVLRMDGILVWHTYRLLDGSKTHLL